MVSNSALISSSVGKYSPLDAGTSAVAAADDASAVADAAEATGATAVLASRTPESYQLVNIAEAGARWTAGRDVRGMARPCTAEPKPMHSKAAMSSKRERPIQQWTRPTSDLQCDVRGKFASWCPGREDAPPRPHHPIPTFPREDTDLRTTAKHAPEIAS